MIKLKELRIQSGLTQKKVAEKLGIAYKNYNTYELGRAMPDIETLIKIANFYHVSLDYLCGNDFHRVELGFLTDTKEAIVKAVKELNDVQSDKALSYICGLLGKTDTDFK
ncbi:MAG: helix-turn-helix transcriptional regulator [Clostridia bacterium]|nr:helix-turn-helix transcriptional regulator [Clostridia bacterium]